MAKPETEVDLLPLAEGATTAQVERMVRVWKLNSRLEEEEIERQRYRSRSCSVYPEGGMYVFVARLPADEGALIRSGIDAESDAIYREQQTADAEPGMSELEDGTRISCETARRVACDAGIGKMTRNADGSILDVGRRTARFRPLSDGRSRPGTAAVGSRAAASATPRPTT